MLKIRLIPILTFNGISLVKTKQFSNEDGWKSIQAARVYNTRNVDELVFVDIKASSQKEINLSLVKKVIDECFMPVTIGGGIHSKDHIQQLLAIGADKVLIKSKAITDPEFIANAVEYFWESMYLYSSRYNKKEGNYMIYYDGEKKIPFKDFIQNMEIIGVGEMIINSVDRDGLMEGFDYDHI